MSAPPYPALTIAKWFVAWAEAEEEDLSNLKLQKLLYYAQGHYLARYNAPLFEDEIQAWVHGPVVAPVYQAFKSFGAASVALEDSDPFEWEDVDPATTEFLGEVWNTYGGYSTGRLREMAYATPPWRRSWRVDDDRGALISQKVILEYFRQFAAA